MGENKEVKLDLADQLTNALHDNENAIKDNIVGKILTIVEAAIADERQLKAVKDLIRQSFWTQEVYGDSWHIVNSFLANYGEGKLKPSDYWIDHKNDIPRSGYFK